jgi:hypothetical protein
MRLILTRLDERRYETLVTRADGVSFRVQGVGHMFAIPHDLAHLAVEEALGLDRGFWGSVASGAVFPSMNHLSGRRRPHAGERSRELLKANRDTITEAETLVSLFNTALQQGHGADSAVLRARLREQRWTPAGQSERQFTDAEIESVCAAWQRMLDLWRPLPVGDSLHLEWVEGSRQRPRRSR